MTTTEELILKKLTSIEQRLVSSSRVEVYTDGALEILRLTNQRDLKALRDLGHIQKWTKREGGKSYSYVVAELNEVREKLDRGEISLSFLKNFK